MDILKAEPKIKSMYIHGAYKWNKKFEVHSKWYLWLKKLRGVVWDGMATCLYSENSYQKISRQKRFRSPGLDVVFKYRFVTGSTHNWKKQLRTEFIVPESPTLFELFLSFG